MPPPHTFEGRITNRARRRATCVARIACGSLFKGFRQSGEFHTDGWKWLLALTLVVIAGRPIGIGIHLCSGVAGCGRADIELAISIEGTEVFRKKKSGSVTRPFGVLYEDSVLISKFGKSLEQLKLHDTFDVTVDLKNIKFATKSQHESCEETMLPVSVEIIDAESIGQYLNDKAFGVASSDGLQVENVLVHSGSSTYLWANRDPKFRYWLVKKGKDGGVVLTRCLNDASVLEQFKDICDERNDSGSKITLFREERENDNVPFPDADGDTVVIFVKIYQPAGYEGDLTYVGHIQVQKMMTVQELLLEITDNLTDLSIEECDAYLEEAGLCIRDITLETSKLANCSMLSGSVVILREKKPEDQEVDLEGVQTALRRIHEQANEPSKSMRGEIRQNFPFLRVEECPSDAPETSYTADGDIASEDTLLSAHNVEIPASSL